MLWRITDIGKVMMRAWITKPSAWLLVWSSWVSLAGLLGFGLAEISTPPRLYEPQTIANGSTSSNWKRPSSSTDHDFITLSRDRSTSTVTSTIEK